MYAWYTVWLRMVCKTRLYVSFISCARQEPPYLGTTKRRITWKFNFVQDLFMYLFSAELKTFFGIKLNIIFNYDYRVQVLSISYCWRKRCLEEGYVLRLYLQTSLSSITWLRASVWFTPLYFQNIVWLNTIGLLN